MALAYGYVHRHHAPGQRFEGMCNVSIHRLLVVTQDGFLLLLAGDWASRMFSYLRVRSSDGCLFIFP